MSRRNHDFQTIRSEGGLLPPDLLRRLLDPKPGIEGMKPEDYGLPQSERINAITTQAWTRLRKHWLEFKGASANLSESEPGTGLTNDKWNLPLLRELGFGVLPTTTAPEINGKTYAINRFFGPVPLHLIGCGLSLDRRAAGVRGAAAANPHGLVQELLNRSKDHLWAILSNGLRLRILRDNAALSRQSYLEFDLEAMFDGEVYPDFVLLWLVGHATRFAPREANRPDTCWIEQWTKEADDQGTRALGDLRAGVEKALQTLGEGFTTHPRNTALRDDLRSGRLTLNDFHGQLLRAVYRLIFLFVAEDRTVEGLPLLHPPDNSDQARVARERYASHYSTARLREMAGRIKGSRHGDLWRQFQLLVGALSGDVAFADARKQLALPALGSFLWNPASTASLNNAELTNHDFLEALRNLAFTRQGKVLRPVAYRDLGAEELGGVYESLLALTPQISADGAKFTFAEFAGSERKTSGSYYTHDSLVQCLLDSALDPVVDEAIKGKNGKEAEKAILDLKVCDPAVGSGHFLVGAAHRLARHLARIRAQVQGESEPSPLLYQHALRDVIANCLYGVDINPMAAELCRVGLWLEALEPGKPLSFLDHHIQVGNSLLGTIPALLKNGIPDEAFTPIEGDDKAVCREYKKINKEEREKRQIDLFGYDAKPWEQLGNMTSRLSSLIAIEDDTVENVHKKEALYAELVRSTAYEYGKLLADMWCASFVWKKTKEFPYPITEEVFRKAEKNPFDMPPWMKDEIKRLAGQYQFFHWHLAFPDVFVPNQERHPERREGSDSSVTSWTGGLPAGVPQGGTQAGFDILLGNPPWERVKLQEKEWFANRSPDIANARNAAERKRMIEALETVDPALYSAFLDDRRKAEGESQLLRQTERYPLCGRGDINTYAVFAELFRSLINGKGRVGIIVPSGIATDDTTKFFFRDLMDTKTLASLYDFENRANLFPEVDSRMKFCLLTLSGLSSPQTQGAEFVFFAHTTQDLLEDERRFTLTAEDIALLNPESFTSPVIRYKRDLEVLREIYQKGTLLEGPEWRGKYVRLIHLSDHAAHIRMKEDLAGGVFDEFNQYITDKRLLQRVYEAKLIHHFEHRYATYDGVSLDDVRKGNARENTPPELAIDTYYVKPRYWVDRTVYEDIMSKYDSQNGWLLAYRDITNTTNERTSIAAAIPDTPATVSVPCIGIADSSVRVQMLGNLCAFAFDYAARQKVPGTHLSWGILNQLPFLAPSVYRTPCLWQLNIMMASWIKSRVLELTYTAWDLFSFAKQADYSGPPYKWDESRRFLIRCELDAAYFHLYGIERDDVDYIMETFPIVKRKDEKEHGEYRTKRVILEIYDEMAEAMRTGVPYKTRLDPPPGPPEGGLPEWKPGEPKPENWPSHIHPPRGITG